MHFPELSYDCVRCGKGCRVAWPIPVEAELVEPIESSSSAALVRRRGYRPLTVARTLGQTEEGSCVFLGDDSLCSLHAEAGPQAKPLQCRRFPFFTANTPGGVYVGLSFFCTAVQEGSGRPAAAHEPWLSELIGGEPPALPADTRIALGPGVALSWSEYLDLEARLLAALASEDLSEATWSFCWTLLGLRGRSEVALPDEARPFLEHVRRSFVALLVATVEVPPGPARPAAAQALAEGQSLGQLTLSSPHLFDDSLARRYLSHLVFRKYLLEGESLLRNAALLWLLVPLLEVYAGPDGKILRALDVAETEVVTHGNAGEAVAPALESALLELWEACRG